MRRPCSLVLTLIAWLFATGSQWDLVQTFAWGRMFTSYSRSMPLLQAAQKTFAQEGMCDLCKLVQKAKQDDQETKTPGGKTLEKILLAHAPRTVVFIAAVPAEIGIVRSAQIATGIGRAAPWLLPPRAAV